MNFKKIITIVLAVVLVVLAVILIARGIQHNNEVKAMEAAQNSPYLRVAQLYAIKPDETFILKDTEGDLWEVDKSVNINENDQLLLEISGKNITHIWVEIVIDTGNGDGETPES